MKISILNSFGGFELENKINLIFAGCRDNLRERKKYKTFWNSSLTYFIRGTRSGPDAASLVSSANKDENNEVHLGKSLI